MAAKLVAEEGLLKELVLSLEGGDQWIIGRDPDACQLIIEDPTASRQHALCRKTDDGIIVENLSKSSPLLVNEEPVTHPRLLREGDMVKIGDTTFRFYGEAEAQVEEPQNTEEGAPPRITGAGEEPHEEEHTDTIFQDNGAAAPAIAEVNFGLMETGRWLLKVISGPNNGAEFSMQAGKEYLIGTDPNTCDIVFYDISVSRQHARVTVYQDDSLSIEDLKSRNGTRVDGELLQGKKALVPNSVVIVGTTSFVVYDREGEMQTVISPMLPSILKVIQKEESDVTAKPVAETTEASQIASQQAAETAPPRKIAIGSFILTGVLLGILVILGFALQSLFVQTPVPVEQPVDTENVLKEALASFQNVKYNFNKSTGRLLLIGHVLTASDKSQLMYNLQGLHFIREIDDSGVIIDEYVWTETNQILSKNPLWKGITIHSPSPGRYVLSGYLQTRSQAEQLWDYISRNFPYLDLLENKVVVEEDIIGSALSALRNQGFTTVSVKLANGELTLSGNVATGSQEKINKLITEFKELPGVRQVHNLTVEKAPSEAVVNISDRYTISGSSRTGAGKLNVVINGRILSEGDILDGMTITHIEAHYVLLKRDNIVYRIDF